MIAKITARAADLLDDDRKATAWFRFQPLMAFGGKTAQEMVAAGQAAAVLAHLDTLDRGGFA